MAKIPEHNYCNYCKHFHPSVNYPSLPNMSGYCEMKVSLFSRMLHFAWWTGCKEFEYTIHQRFGFDSVEQLEECADNFKIVENLPIKFHYTLETQK